MPLHAARRHRLRPVRGQDHLRPDRCEGGSIKGDVVGGKRELTASAPAGDRPRRDRPSSGTRPRRSGSSGTTATSTEAGRAATGDTPEPAPTAEAPAAESSTQDS